MSVDPESAMRTALATILQDALDLDSMDFLNFLIAVAQSTGVEIPESDYHLVRTFAGCRDYVGQRVDP
jgi:acyl carrier protein